MKRFRTPLFFLVFLCLVCGAQTHSMATPAAGDANAPGRVRTYYIAADEVMWDYVPTKPTFLPRGEQDLAVIPRAKSSKYLKILYREYTAGDFKTLKPRPPEWEHLGVLGPLLRAEVGDTLHVVFKNNSRMPATMHPHGLFYDKASEGAYYGEDPNHPPDLSHKANVVLRGEVVTYTWTVPERAGPGAGDPSSILWMYHSHYSESRDMNAGLVGPIIISRKGTTQADGTPKDVDREFVVAFSVFQENISGLFMWNIVHEQKYGPEVIRDPGFTKTLEYFTMNGYTRGTMPLLTMKNGERVRWYMFANGNEDDVHAPHWHGQIVTYMGMHTDTLNLGPMGMIVADMVADNPGTWLFHCHVNDHLDGGMYSLFRVTP